MQVRELRIGNYALTKGNYENSGDYQETYITANHIKEIDLSELLCSGVPLTEEWLLKFGFEEVDYAGGCYNLGIVCIDTSDFNCVVNGKWLDVKIQYVHQLQNLYYALTQTELQLTEK